MGESKNAIYKKKGLMQYVDPLGFSNLLT